MIRQITVLCLFATSQQLAAEPVNSPALSTTMDRVVVFKDGYSLFSKSAIGKADGSGQVQWGDAPSSFSLGSFWAIPEAGVLRNIVAKRWVELEQGRQEPQSSLVFRFDPASIQDGAIRLKLHYFRPGIRWIPTYRVSLDGDEAHLHMQAEILNEAEALEEVDLRLVVGTPNFQFKDVPSPMVFETGMVNPLTSVAPTLMNQMQGQSRFGERSERERVAGPAAADMPAMPDLPGDAMQDLFFYEVPRFTLGVGERAIVPVASANVPARHVYTWNLTLWRSGQELSQPATRGVSTLQVSKDEVWHSVDLKNESQRPWTTGPAFFNEGFLPIAQPLLKYTPIGGTTRVPLTPAPDIAERVTERELERVHDVREVENRKFTRIKKEGLLEITNFKTEPIEVVIECEIAGNVLSASDGGEKVLSDYRAEDWKDFHGSPALNGHSTVTWALNVEAGGTKTVTCEYEYFVWQ